MPCFRVLAAAYAPDEVVAVRVCVEEDCSVVTRPNSAGLGGPPIEHGFRKPREVLVTAELVTATGWPSTAPSGGCSSSR